MSKKQSDYMLEFGGKAISYRANILVVNPYPNKLVRLLTHLQTKELIYRKLQERYDKTK